MSGLKIDPVVLTGEHAELIRYPSDEIWLRAVGHGDIQVTDGAICNLPNIRSGR